MAHNVQVNTGYNGVELPNGRFYTGPVTVTLTDDQYALLSPTVFTSGILTDLGVPGNTPLQGSVQRVTAGGAAPGQSLKNFTGKVALSTTLVTTQPIYTVTVGKNFLLTDLFISHDNAAVLDVRIQGNGVDIFRAPIKGDTAPLQMPGIESQPLVGGGQVLQIVWPATPGPPNAYFFVGGVES